MHVRQVLRVVRVRRQQHQDLVEAVNLESSDTQDVDAQVELVAVDQQRPLQVPLQDPLANLKEGRRGEGSSVSA